MWQILLFELSDSISGMALHAVIILLIPGHIISHNVREIVFKRTFNRA